MPDAACPDPETEAALLARLRSDDEVDGYDAAVEIITRYRRVMETAARHALDDWVLAEDVAQEVSLAFMRGYRTAVVRDGLQRYFGHASRTRALNLVRAERRGRQRAALWGVPAVSENDGPLHLAMDDLTHAVSRALAA